MSDTNALSKPSPQYNAYIKIVRGHGMLCQSIAAIKLRKTQDNLSSMMKEWFAFLFEGL